mmetsp:Transcript_4920/g.14316  ORF Transcript_4920/g.14316 Transcript_4920/m.14316 type:complete len:576 (+) Transcript_4920:123-1850(+)
MAVRGAGRLALLLAAGASLGGRAQEAAEGLQQDADCELDQEDAAAAKVMLLQTQLQRQRHRRGALAEASAQAVTPSATVADAAPSAMRPHGASQAFVFLFEWSWQDIAKECEEWLGPKGFTAVLVSPPNEHTVGESWYRRYQPVSYNLTSRSGNQEQFVDMVKRCQKAGVGIYADAVFNHCAPMSGVGVGGSTFGSRTYPLYGPQDFHHLGPDSSTNCGVSNYNDLKNVQYCDLQGMPDLCTSCPKVQETVAAYINHMAELGVAGFRVDAAKHMDPGELGGLLQKVNSSLFWFLEVTAVPGEAVQTPMYYSDGRVTEFGYASTLKAKFKGEGMLRDDFQKFGEGWGLVPNDKAVVFLDNHDTQRNGQAQITFKEPDLYILLNIFMLAHPYGYPKVMSSYYYTDNDQGPPKKPVHGPSGEVHCGPDEPWVCEHRLAPIANMVAWRRMAGGAGMENFATDGDTLSFCRGGAACVALNRKNATLEVQLHFSLPNGEYCDVLQSADPATCPKVKIQDGAVRLALPAVGAVALHAGALAASPEASAETTTAAPREDEDTETEKPYEELEDQFEDSSEDDS